MARYYIKIGLVSGQCRVSKTEEYTDEEVSETLEIIKSIKSLTYLSVDQENGDPLIVNPDNVEFIEMVKERPF